MHHAKLSYTVYSCYAVIPTLKETSIDSARRYAFSAATGSPSCARHNPIIFQSVFASTLDLTTSPKSNAARVKYINFECRTHQTDEHEEIDINM